MTMLYPNMCYNEVCYKETALYMDTWNYGNNFLGTQGGVQITHGKRTICVEAFEVLLYVVLWEISLQKLNHVYYWPALTVSKTCI